MVLITIILSYFTLIFGELVPKRIAMQRPMDVAKIASGVIRAIATVMRPVIWFLSASTNAVLRLLRMKVEAEEEAVTEEEIRLMVDLGEEKGTIDASEKELIENIFEFDNTKVDEVMTRCVDIIAIQKDARPKDILALIRSSGLSRFPVYGRVLTISSAFSTRGNTCSTRAKRSLCHFDRNVAPGLLRTGFYSYRRPVSGYAEKQTAYRYRYRRIRRDSRFGHNGGPAGGNRRQYL